jgi:hypothetical protein
MITSVADFVRAVAEIKTAAGCELFFRGHADKNYQLVPSLYRAEKFYLHEDKLYKDTILYNPQEFLPSNTTLENLVKMRHFSLPTRILDMSRNALVALYFACQSSQESEKDRAGEVVVLQIPKKEMLYFDSDRAAILANLAKLSNEKLKICYKEHAKGNKPNNGFGYLLHCVREDKPHFIDFYPEAITDLKKVFPVYVKLDNPRIDRQLGAFLIFGIANEDKQCPAQLHEQWILRRLSISAAPKHKEKISQELDVLFGINEAVLKPGLSEGFAKWLKGKHPVENK